VSTVTDSSFISPLAGTTRPPSALTADGINLTIFQYCTRVLRKAAPTMSLTLG